MEAPNSQTESNNLEALLNQLQYGYRDEKEDAAQVLSAFGDSILPQLVQIFKTTDEHKIRWEIGNLIGKMGERAVKTLIELINDKANSREVRRLAIVALKLTDTSSIEAVETVGKILTDKNSDKEIRESALQALVKLDKKQALPYLLIALQSKLFGYSNAYAWSQLGEDALQPLLTFITNPEVPSDVVEIAISALALLGDIARQPLYDLVRISNKKIQNRAYWSLAEMKDPIAIKFLLNILKDPKNKATSEAVRLLETFNTHQAIEPLLNLMLSPSCGYFSKDRIGLALSRLDNLKVIESLRPFYLEEISKEAKIVLNRILYAMDDPIYSFQAAFLHADEEIYLQARQIVIKVANNFKPDSADQTFNLEPLVLALKHPTPLIRECAAKALGNLENIAYQDRVVDGLLDSLEDVDQSVKISAIVALGKLGNKKAIEPLVLLFEQLQPSDVRWKLIEALAKLGDKRVLNSLVELLSNPDTSEELRFACVELLPFLEDHRAFEPLLKIVIDLQQEDRWLMLGAVRALVKLRYPKIYDLLIELLTHEYEDIRQEVCLLLGELGDKRAIPVLRNVEKYDEGFDIDVNVSMAAADAINKLKGKDTFMDSRFSKKRSYPWNHI